MSHRILLIDDNQHLRKSVKLLLEENNFEVILASNITQAVNHLMSQTPDLIILDIMIPNQNGYNLINYIHSKYYKFLIPIIILTAKGLTSDRIKGYNLGCSAYLSKPFDPNELMSIINNLVSMKSSKTTTQTKNMSLNQSRDNLLIQNLKFTVRELSVLSLVVKGSTNKEIAKFLHTSKRNVEKYVSKLLVKTQTRNRTELTQLVSRNKYIS